MSQRRLFSQIIVGSDTFLDMPATSQLLYFHLCMYADDDGFVNPKKIMRLMSASDDDLKILIAKRFVILFENKVIIIKHWLIHNTIRRDRYKETIYLEEKKLIIIKENGVYTELATSRQPVGNQPVPQVKLSKVKLNNATESPKGSFTGLQSLLNSPQKHIRLIGFFFERKGLEFSTPEEWTQATKRWMRTAVSLSKFDSDKITKAFEQAETWREWQLDTVYKKITGQNQNDS